MLELLTRESKLAIALRSDRYLVIPTLPHWIRIQAKTKRDMLTLFAGHSEALSEMATRVIVYMGHKQSQELIRIYKGTETMNKGHLEDICINGLLRPTLPILRTMELMLTDRENSYGLVDPTTGRQLVLNGGAGGRFLVGADIEEATQWRREDYWRPDHLADAQRRWRQELSVDGWVEFTYETFDPKDPNRIINARFTNAFKLIDDGNGGLYHLGKNIAREPVNV